jgi:hypothetical protein
VRVNCCSGWLVPTRAANTTVCCRDAGAGHTSPGPQSGPASSFRCRDAASNEGRRKRWDCGRTNSLPDLSNVQPRDGVSKGRKYGALTRRSRGQIVCDCGHSLRSHCAAV